MKTSGWIYFTIQEKFCAGQPLILRSEWGVALGVGCTSVGSKSFVFTQSKYCVAVQEVNSYILAVSLPNYQLLILV